MDAADFLQCAVGLVADPEHWTKGAYTRPHVNKAGQVTGEYRYCATGALRRAYLLATREHGVDAQLGAAIFHQAEEFLKRVWILSGFMCTEDGNDASTHAAMLDRFYRAIQLAKEARDA